MPSMWEILGHCIPKDHCRQVRGRYYLHQLPETPTRLLDHGCGSADLRDWLNKHKPDFSWKGVDIACSPEVDARPQERCALNDLYTYDGITLPFPDNSFDVVYSNNVFEHVRHPEAALDEIHRVLTPGGHFIASLSYLYPLHSYSIFNYTPYGWFTLLDEHGFDVHELRPGIDGIASILRGYHGAAARFSQWFSSSPFNRFIQKMASKHKLTIQQTNMRMLMNTGIIHSLATKP